ncbi:MAG: ABC transporter substrate-binding protein [Pseudolabrys sp.]|nr:ABC transporter substrate-binding protein [Pseudolabrys sp.]
MQSNLNALGRDEARDRIDLALQVVASKGDTFGQIDAGAAALARSKGAPLKVIATYMQKTQGALVSFKETGINKPEDAGPEVP